MAERFKYRPEIDGLRALAVLAVIFFHGGFHIVSGGYVGVDVFFVISGYLITSIIFQELREDTFSFKNFWLRRARRILPAAMTMMLFTAVVMAFFYPTSYYEDFGKTLLAQTFFSANILFWKQGGYFATAQELKPLLHTWSLAVEEQFYMLFPLFMWGTFRFFRNRLTLILGLICLVSLGLSIYTTEFHPIPAFYLLPTRAWELGIGALLGVLGSGFFSNHKIVNNVAATLGLGAIICAIFFFDEKTPFPSYFAALPVFGTAAIIWANTRTQTLVGNLFTLKPVVAIGLVSYSLYLWHWPVIVLNNWMFPERTSVTHHLVVLLVATVLAVASYYLIETPIRKNRQVFTNSKIVGIALTSSTAALVLGLVIVLIGNRFLVDPQGNIGKFYEDAMQPEANRKDCLDLFRTKSEKISCRYTYNLDSMDTDLFVWGDSHASAIIPAFDLIAKEQNYNLEFSAMRGCQPVVGMRRVDWFQFCAEGNHAVLQHIENSSFPLVIMVGSFVNNVSLGKLRDVEADGAQDAEKGIREFDRRFKETVAQVKATGANVLVFTEPPRLGINPVNEYIRKKTLNMKFDEFIVDRAAHLQRIARIYTLIDASGIDKRLDYTDFFCDPQQCRALDQGRSLYKDDGHISVFGAEQISAMLGADIKTELSILKRQ